jgi:hypothetical protein
VTRQRTFAGAIDKGRSDETGASPGGAELRQILAVVDKRNVGRTGEIQRTHVGDPHFGGTFSLQLAARRARQLAEGDRRLAIEKTGMFHRYRLATTPEPQGRCGRTWACDTKHARTLRV